MRIGLLTPGEEMLRLNQRDRDRLSVLRQVGEGVISAARGAERVGLSVRHFRRLRRRFEAEGDAAVVHGARGRASNRRFDAAIHKRALERAQEPLFRDFRPTLLAEHLSRDPQIGTLNPHTLRKWLIEAGLWEVRRSRHRHRKARPRRAALGELIQLDGSDHRWLEERHAGRLTLLQAIDDATSRIMIARFVPRETGAAHRRLIIDYLETHGRPVAVYTDKAACFGQSRRHRSSIPLEEREASPTVSIIRSALEALGTGLILAGSPEAKGRVERDFGTAQDRLVKEMRVAAISTLEEANNFLETYWVPFWNDRFAVEPAESTDAHRPLPKKADLERLFADTVTRVVSNDFTIRYRNQRLQISRAQARGIRPKGRITVERRLDGTTRFRFEERYLDLEVVEVHALRRPDHRSGVLPGTNGRKPKPSTPAPMAGDPPRPSAPPKPGPDHPWRRYPILVGRRLNPTPAASRPAPPSPQIRK